MNRWDESGFGDGIRISDNTMTHSTVGISLFKMRNVNIFWNSISSTSAFSLYGVLISQSYNVFAFSNVIRWWPTGVSVTGRPGDVTRLGSSYDGVGIKPPLPWDESWSTPGNAFDGNVRNTEIRDAGYGNNVIPM
jgi:hypothetical protein